MTTLNTLEPVVVKYDSENFSVTLYMPSGTLSKVYDGLPNLSVWYKTPSVVPATAMFPALAVLPPVYPHPPAVYAWSASHVFPPPVYCGPAQLTRSVVKTGVAVNVGDGDDVLVIVGL